MMPVRDVRSANSRRPLNTNAGAAAYNFEEGFLDNSAFSVTQADEHRGRSDSGNWSRRSPLVGWLTVLALVATAAVCGWYSQHVPSFVVAEVESHDAVPPQLLLAQIDIQDGSSDTQVREGSQSVATVMSASAEGELHAGNNTVPNPSASKAEDQTDKNGSVPVQVKAGEDTKAPSPAQIAVKDEYSEKEPETEKPKVDKAKAEKAKAEKAKAEKAKAEKAKAEKAKAKKAKAEKIKAEKEKAAKIRAAKPKPPQISTNQTEEDLWAPMTSLSEMKEFECNAWRQTKDCNGRGKLNPARDASCDEVIVPDDSGFCEYKHRKTGLLRRIVPSNCNSRASQMEYTCRNASMLVRYGLMAVEYEPDYPLSFPGNRRDLLMENGFPTENQTASDANVKAVVPQSKLESGSMASKPPTSFARGIAYVVYEELFLSVYASIKVLRSSGCTLPVELWYATSETNTSHPVLQELTRDYGAYLRVIKDPRATRFYTKIYATFYSAFDQMLLLDADNFAAKDPTPLFTSQAFNDTGAVFWPDFWMPNRTIFTLKKKSDVWDLMDVPYVDMFEQESGQVLVDRTRHVPAMHAMLHYGLTEPHFPAEFNMLWGDKDLFRFAWMRTNSSFHMIHRPPGSAGLKAPHLNIFCGTTMVQHDPAGEIAFLHRNIVKFLPGGDHDLRLWRYIQQYKKDQDYRRYNVGGEVDHRWFPQVRKCYGKRTNYLHRGYTLTPIEDFSFATLEDDIIGYVKEAEAIMNKAGWATATLAEK